MTRRFRLNLFVAIAAAVGLHLEPCAVCLVGELFGIEDPRHESSTRTLVQPPPALDGDTRPSITAMGAGPRIADGAAFAALAR